MLKQGLGIGLLCIAGHAYCDSIIVNTTADEVKDDQLCSLREAVEYINRGSPESGYNGCGGKDSNPVILLEKSKTYELKSKIEIKKALQIKTTYDTTITNQLGLNNATIKMTGADQIFRIRDDSTQNEQYNVQLTEVNLDGCAKDCGIAQGGLIYNQETLVLSYVTLKNGYANLGGAIYNAQASTTDKSSGSVTIINSLMQNNTASQGAVIYSDLPRFVMIQSVVRDNTATTTTTPTLFFSAAKFSDDLTAGFFSSGLYGVKNSTILKNTGYLINLRDGQSLNNNTLVRNSLGIYFDAPLGNAYLANSIVVENGIVQNEVLQTAKNCTFTSSDKSLIQNNLVNSDCGSGSSNAPNINLGAVKLFAGSSVEGKCTLAPAEGLLCPFATPSMTFLGFFRPRLLLSYNSFDDSLVVNRGRISGTGACESVDQRGKSRTTNQLCDLGAIELVIDTSSIATVGSDILYGEQAKFSIAEQLTDGELVPASACEAILGKRKDGKAWQVGCLDVIQTNTPSKGALTLDQDGNVVYTPNGNWHGTDEFKIRVVTTFSRFSSSTNSKYIDIPVRIVQNPPNTFEDKKVSTGGGGSFGWGSLIVLGGLMMWRRKRQQ